MARWFLNMMRLGLAIKKLFLFRNHCHYKKKFLAGKYAEFFAGILPEESKRELVAKNLGISKTNDFIMIERIGGECAGAITFIKQGEKLPEDNYNYKNLSEENILHLLEILPSHPLLAGEDGVRLSLAGAQDKIAVTIKNGEISIPLGGAPSTHILKPENPRFEGLVDNEAFCMRLSKAIGLPTARVETRSAKGKRYLLVERYDRIINPSKVVERLHQEDFCQALGVASEMKYQTEGGPSLKNCFELLRGASTLPAIDLVNLLDGVIFNLLIGNNDAHGKNFSFLYQNNQTRLAPFYDLLSTLYYPNLSKKMAMKIGKESDSSKITTENFDRMAEDCNLSKPLVKQHVVIVAEKVLDKLSEVNFGSDPEEKLCYLIENRCKLFLANFK